MTELPLASQSGCTLRAPQGKHACSSRAEWRSSKAELQLQLLAVLADITSARVSRGTSIAVLPCVAQHPAAPALALHAGMHSQHAKAARRPQEPSL